MRIYAVSPNVYANKRNNPSFGFWQPGMSSAYRSQTVSGATKNNWSLEGKIIREKLHITGWIDNFKSRHVNIKGSQNKIKRTSFNHYDYDGLQHKCQQDLYPDGDLITKITYYNNGKVGKTEEFIENVNDM